MWIQLNRLDPEFPRAAGPISKSSGGSTKRSAPGVIYCGDLGDMDRIEEERRQLAPSRYRSSRQTALRAADGFLAELLGAADLDKEWILIISPLPTGEDIGRGGF